MFAWVAACAAMTEVWVSLGGRVMARGVGCYAAAQSRTRAKKAMQLSSSVASMNSLG
jgi:hypothetical protein